MNSSSSALRTPLFPWELKLHWWCFSARAPHPFSEVVICQSSYLRPWLQVNLAFVSRHLRLLQRTFVLMFSQIKNTPFEAC